MSAWPVNKSSFLIDFLQRDKINRLILWSILNSVGWTPTRNARLANIFLWQKITSTIPIWCSSLQVSISTTTISRNTRELCTIWCLRPLLWRSTTLNFPFSFPSAASPLRPHIYNTLSDRSFVNFILFSPRNKPPMPCTAFPQCCCPQQFLPPSRVAGVAVGSYGLMENDAHIFSFTKLSFHAKEGWPHTRITICWIIESCFLVYVCHWSDGASLCWQPYWKEMAWRSTPTMPYITVFLSVFVIQIKQEYPFLIRLDFLNMSTSTKLITIRECNTLQSKSMSFRYKAILRN